MLAMLIGLNKIPKILFMSAFATSLFSIVDPHTNCDPSPGLELGLRLGLGLGLGLGVRVGLGLGAGLGPVLGWGLGLRIVLGCKVDKTFLRATLVPMERCVPSAPMDAQGRHLWQLTVGQRPLEGGGGGQG